MQFSTLVGVNKCDEGTISAELAQNEVFACPQSNDGPSLPSVSPQSYDVDTTLVIFSDVTASVDGERMLSPIYDVMILLGFCVP